MHKLLAGALAVIALITTGTSSALLGATKDKNPNSPAALLDAAFATEQELPGYVAVKVTAENGTTRVATCYTKRAPGIGRLIRVEIAYTSPTGETTKTVLLSNRQGTWRVSEDKTEHMQQRVFVIDNVNPVLIDPAFYLDRASPSEVRNEGEVDWNGMRCLKLRRTLPDDVVAGVRLRAGGKDLSAAETPLTLDEKAKTAILRLIPRGAANTVVANEFLVDLKSGVPVCIRTIWGDGMTRTERDYKKLTVDANLSDSIFELPAGTK